MEQIGLRLLLVALPFSVLGIADMIVGSKMLDEVDILGDVTRLDNASAGQRGLRKYIALTHIPPEEKCL